MTGSGMNKKKINHTSSNKTEIKCPHCGKDLSRQDLGKLLGKQGGLTTKKKYGKSYYVEIGKKGMKSRWGKT